MLDLCSSQKKYARDKQLLALKSDRLAEYALGIVAAIDLNTIY